MYKLLILFLLAPKLLFANDFSMEQAGNLASDVREIIIHDPKSLPNIEFFDDKDQKLSLANFSGRVVILNIWATWCSPCRVEMPDLDKLQADYKGKKLEVIALSQDEQGAKIVNEFYQANNLKNLRIYIDKNSAARSMLGVNAMPTTFVIDGDNKSIMEIPGIIKWNDPEMRKFMDQMVADNIAKEKQKLLEIQQLEEVDRKRGIKINSEILSSEPMKKPTITPPIDQIIIKSQSEKEAEKQKIIDEKIQTLEEKSKLKRIEDTQKQLEQQGSGVIIY